MGECEKCNSTQQGTRRWILQATCNDGTGSRYVNFFDDTAVVMFGGKSADEVAALKNHGNQGAFDSHFINHSFKQYKMKVRIKSEQYNDENRLKVQAIELKPLDYLTEGRTLLNEIRAGMAPGY